MLIRALRNFVPWKIKQSNAYTLVTGANQGIGLEVVKKLVAADHTVLLGSRDLAKGEAAAKEAGAGAIAIQIDVTDQSSIEA